MAGRLARLTDGFTARAEAGRSPLPEGTLAVGVGLLVSGLTSYGFLVLSARALGPDAYAPLGLLWTAMFLVGPGLFLPVEQEVSRALAARAARGLGGGPVLKRAGMLAAVLMGVLVVTMVAGGPALVDHLFDDQALLLVGLAIGLAGTAAGHLARGACSGQGRFRPYAVFLGADGVIRLALCAVLAVIGVETAGWFGLALGAAPALAVLVALRGERGLVVDGPDAGWGEVSKALLALLLGSILSFTLINGSPIAVKILGTEAERADAGRFLNGLIVARVPLFLFQAVQASLLPKLSALAGGDRFDEFRSGLKNLLVVTGGIGLLASLGAFAVGPLVVTGLFGAEYELDRRTLGLLALGCALYMVASALAQAVIALAGHRLVAAAWGAGVVAFVAVTALSSDDLYFRVELGLLAGSAASATAMAAALVHRLRAGARPDREAVIDALHDLPFEP